MPYDPITGKWKDPKAVTTQTAATDPSDPNAPTGDPSFQGPTGSGESAAIPPRTVYTSPYVDPRYRQRPVPLPGGGDIPAPGGGTPGGPDVGTPPPTTPGTPPPPPPPTPPPTPPPPPPPPPVDPWRAYVDKAFAASGHAPPTEEDYALWGGYWKEWGSGDPEYFLRKMTELTGPGNNYGAGWPNLPGAIFTAAPVVPPYVAPPGGGGGGGTTTTTTGGGSNKELDDATRQAILKLLASKPPTGEMLMQTPEMSAFRLASQRGQERDVAQLAEDAAYGNFSGTPEFQAKRRGLGVERGQAEAKFLGELAISRLQDQREDIVNGIAAAQKSSQFDAEQALKLQLAQMDDAIKRMQIDQDRYSTDVGAATTRRGQDITRDISLSGQAIDRYGIDVGSATTRRGQDITSTGQGIDWKKYEKNLERYNEWYKATGGVGTPPPIF
jgi:hypothetical protein